MAIWTFKDTFGQEKNVGIIPSIVFYFSFLIYDCVGNNLININLIIHGQVLEIDTVKVKIPDTYWGLVDVNVNVDGISIGLDIRRNKVDSIRYFRHLHKKTLINI